MKKIIEHTAVLAVVCSVFSQMDGLAAAARPLMYGLWVAALGMSLAERRGRLSLSPDCRVFIASYAVFAAYCLTAGFFDGAHLRANYLRVLLVPLLLTVFVEICPDSVIGQEQRLAKAFVLPAGIFAVYVHVKYISAYSAWLAAKSYVYPQKNSAAQIWSCAILLALFLIRPRGLGGKMMWYGISAYLLLVVALSQCRTALLALGLGAAGVVLFRSKHKLRWCAALAAALAFLWLHPFTRRFLNQVLLLERYAGADLNTLSSGRLESCARAWEAFIRSPLLGVGKWYVDCSYLLILTESGLIGFVLIELVWVRRIRANIPARSTGENAAGKQNFLVMITVFYLVESLLEGYPPFGPGVSALGFWLFTGILARQEGRLRRGGGAGRRPGTAAEAAASV